MKDKKLSEAIEYGLVEVVTPSTYYDGPELAHHQRCTTRHVDGCHRCQIGIEEYKIPVCPFCGSDKSHTKVRSGCRSDYNYAYQCGTIVNVCHHYNNRPDNITTVVIGSSCCGLEEDVV